MRKRNCVLDSSFVIDLLNELARGEPAAAIAWLERNGSARLWITPITMAEVLEGAEEPDTVKAYLGRYNWQGINRIHAEKVALRQRRAPNRMGENDAWQAAIAGHMQAVIVGHDKAAFQRLAAGYDDHLRLTS